MSTQLKPQSLDTNLLNGWISANETWTYASATTFTINDDVTSYLRKGVVVRLNQTTGGTKYFIVKDSSVSGGVTTITIAQNKDYSLENETINSPHYSLVEFPDGMPTYFRDAHASASKSSQSVSVATGWLITQVSPGGLLSTDSDPYSLFSSYKFTAPIDGKYLISANAGFGASGGSIGRHYARIVLNSATTLTEQYEYAGGSYNHDVNIAGHIIELSQGDTIHLEQKLDSGGGSTSFTRSSLSANLIGF